MRKLLLFLVCVALVCAVLAATNATSQPQHTLASTQSAQPAPATVPHEPIRIDQLDCAQYASQDECDTWSYSACSTAAMVEVFNSYGRHLRIHDVLKVQAELGEITVKLGLVEDAGIARTAAKFIFSTSWGYNLSYDQVVAKANQGEPVIVGWPPQRYDGGHLVVVTGGTSQTVFLADSSRFDRHSLSRAQFMAWWAGFSAIVTPLGQGGQS